jgi:hypothetical protein
MMTSPRHRRPLLAALLVTGASALAATGCGDDGKTEAKAPIGSPQRPLVARPSESTIGSGSTATAREPGAAPAAAQPQSSGAGASKGASSAKGAATASSESGSTPGPNYAQLLANQTRHPNNRFSPCNLVTARQAAAIVGDPMQQPVEAPQGPTCVYRTRSGRQLIALAVQTVHFAQIKTKLEHRRATTIAGHTAYCGTYGQSMLYVPLSGGRVLSVSAPCDTAKGFAARALSSL